MLNMNRERMNSAAAPRGCARNASVKGGSYNYTIASEPLLPERPDLPIYQRGAGYGVDVSSDIAGMPVYTRNNSTCLTGGGHELINETVAGYTFKPSEAAYMDVIATPGRACAGPVQTGGSGGCAVFGDASAADWGNPTRSVGGASGSKLLKATMKRLAALRKKMRRLAPTIKFRRTRMNTTRKRKLSAKRTHKK